MANTIEKTVMDLIGENSESPDVFTDASGIEEIRSHVNDAIEEICVITGCHKRVWHVPLRGNSVFYRLDQGRDQFAWFDTVYLIGTKRLLEQTDFEGLEWLDSRWMSSTGTPSHYAPIGVSKFAIYPSAASDSDTLEITGVAVPSRYTEDTDRIKLRKSFEWAVVNRAVSEFWATRGDAASAAKAFGLYASEVGLTKMYPEYYERRWQFQGRK
jgi:hypothetical protein